jgi:hypothetical protein
MGPKVTLVAGIVAGLVAWRTGVVAGAVSDATEQVARARLALDPATPSAPTVVLVVYDTTRADHTSLCGYERPTTPTLQALAAKGAFTSCDARTPGTWTLPTHASYFTGLSVPEHGADNVEVPREAQASSGAVLVGGDYGGTGPTVWLAQPLPDDVTTLAEVFRDRGYQTVAVSPNSVVGAELGLAQGFDHVVDVPRESSDPRRAFPADPLPDVARRLAALDRTRPVFLYVNLFFAHDPWPAVPDGLGWVPPREPVVYDRTSPGDPWSAYQKGELAGEARDAFVARIRDAYDWGIRRDDDALGRLLADLERWGWAAAGLRVAVVGDHGEMLGEHGLLGHGSVTFEGNTRVPVVLYDTAGSPPPRADPMNTIEVYDFLRDGRLSGARPVVSFGLPVWSSAIIEEPELRMRNVAIWDGPRKLLWNEGKTEAYDLVADPDELHPLPTTPDEQARLDAEAARLDRFLGGTSADPKVVDLLKAAGYVEDEAH